MAGKTIEHITETLIGSGEALSALQMSVRALILFLIALVLIRLGGMRIFGKKSAFDNVIVIMLGAVLARGVVGASPLWSTVAAAATMVAINKILAWLAARSSKVNKLLKGEALVLYESGAIVWSNMRKAALSHSDLLESLRLETNCESLEKVEKACMETNGRISFILKPA